MPVYSPTILRCIAALLFLLHCGPAFAQKFSIKHITVNEGLPSNETFCLYHKGVGELYIGTEFGLVLYDGEEFRQVPFEDKKYSGAMVFEIKQDKENVLWIKTYRDGLFYLRNDTLRPFVGNSYIRTLIKENLMGELKFDNNSNLWFSLLFYPDTVFKVSKKTGKVTKVPVPGSPSATQAGIIVYAIDSSTSIVVNTALKPRCSNNYNITKENKNFYITVNKDFCNNYSRPETFIQTSEGFIMSLSSKLLRWYQATGKVQLTDMKSEILYMLNDNNNIIMACKNGAYLLNKTTGQVKTIIENQQVTGVLKDKEGIYWFSTNSGLVYMPSIDIYQLSLSDPGFNILAIAGDDNSGRMATVTMDGTLSFYNDRNNTVVAENRVEKQLDKMYPKKLLWLGSEQIVYSHAYYDVKNNKETVFSNKYIGAILDIEEGELKNKLLFAYKKGFSIYNFKEGNKKPQLYSPELFCRAIAEHDGKIYLGDDLGLYRFDGSKNAIRIFTEKINFQVNDIKVIGKKKLIVATRGGGIFIIEGDSVSQLSLNNGLSSDFCTRVITENENTFWAGSNKGLNRIIIQSDGYRIDKWFVEDGLVSDKITDLTRTGNNLFILTDQGINYFNPGKITASKPQLFIHLRSLKINGELQKPGNSSIRIKPGERDLQFDFKIPGFRKGRNIQLRYILHGEDQILSQTGGQSITYKDLSPGQYTLHIQVIGAGGKEIGPVLAYDILVEPRFYETRWFWIVLVATFALLAVLGVIVLLRRSEKERKRKWEYANAQLEALNMQMNPHFIFNALGNIQSLVFGENKLMANNFVVGLSELFRKVLMNANTNLITLSTEIEMLKEYIELELLRLENASFEYSITIDPQLAINHERIPPLLVQPIVENAIWHGLLPAKRKGFLKIIFSKTALGFDIEVIDSGVGIHSGDTVSGNKKRRPSLGLDNVRKRISLFKSMKFGTAKLFIEDLKNTSDISGTRVVLHFEK